MSEYEETALLALLVAAAVSVAAYILAGRMLPRAGWLRGIGRKLHDQKMASLDKPPLSHYKKAVDRQDFMTGYLIIFAGILLKSIVSGFLGLIVIFYLPLGVATIPALAAQHGDDANLRRWAARVTAWQSTSHLLAACIGFSAAWLWIAIDVNPFITVAESAGFSTLVIAASVATALVAAWVETDGHMRKGYLGAESSPSHQGESNV